MMKLPLNYPVRYISDFLNKEERIELYRLLIEEYQIDTLVLKFIINGKVYDTDVNKMMFVTKEMKKKDSLPEKAWGKTAVWSEPFTAVKEKVEQLVGRKFDVGVCIYYPNGNYGVDFHADPPAFGDTAIIPSLSLGEEREFQLRENRTQEIGSIILENGSLVIMEEGCQQNYEHCVPTDPKFKNGRINITFRQYGN